jgi:hypothetical protein
MKKFFVLSSIIVVVSLGFVIMGLIFLGWWYLHSESYCFFWPSIDTTYSEGYSDEKFGKIQIGMTMSDVNKIMGKPLDADDVEYSYTSDGGCRYNGYKFCDCAWLSRTIIFKENKVSEINKNIYYD